MRVLHGIAGAFVGEDGVQEIAFHCEAAGAGQGQFGADRWSGRSVGASAVIAGQIPSQQARPWGGIRTKADLAALPVRGEVDGPGLLLLAVT